MKCLITGGLGYIGSHLALELSSNKDHEVTIIDDLSNGFSQRNIQELDFFKIDITDDAKVDKLFQLKKFDAVFHLAAKKSVEDSMSDPEGYFKTNVKGTENLLRNSKATGVKHFVFASTCAVYGELLTSNSNVDEDARLEPANVYGESKLLAEEAVKEYDGDFQIYIFRFFNVIGSQHKVLMDAESGSLLSNLIHAAITRGPFTIFGTDYPTRDGTCIRDYIDVRDVSRALASSIHWSNPNKIHNRIFNLGTDHGTTVLEMVNEFSRQFGSEIQVKLDTRRPGDIPIIMSDTSKIKREMNFSSVYSLQDSLGSVCDLLTL
jgi:UDP-glucose 4-epimerase